MIIGLWRAKEYVQGNVDMERRDQGYLQFEEIKTFEGVSVSNNFTKYKYFGISIATLPLRSANVSGTVKGKSEYSK